MTFRFEQPWFLCLLALCAIILWWRPRHGGAAFGPFALATMALRTSYGPTIQRLLMAVGIGCLVIAAARPQYGRSIQERTQSGRDLMLVIDLSLSMKIDDMVDDSGNNRDRLAAVMNAAKQFIAGRAGDRIGLVFFGSRALTSCPLTFDHTSIDEFLTRTETLQRQLWADNRRGNGEQGMLGDGTNIGLGLGAALRWLNTEESQGKAVVVITDGKDSTDLPNWEDPVIAARHAAAKNVRVHCIGVGNPNGTLTTQVRFGQVMRVALPAHLLPDPVRLEEIASASGGVALTANDEAALHKVFMRIDELEPSEQHVQTRDDFTDRYLLWLIIGLSLCTIGVIGDHRLRGLR